MDNMMVKDPTYGHMESNPLPQGFHEEYADAPSVDWTARGLKITRLRLLSDPGFPVWDVSYCYGKLNGKPVSVDLPFHQIPKRGFQRFIVEAAKRDGVFAKGIGICSINTEYTIMCHDCKITAKSMCDRDCLALR